MCVCVCVRELRCNLAVPDTVAVWIIHSRCKCAMNEFMCYAIATPYSSPSLSLSLPCIPLPPSSVLSLDSRPAALNCAKCIQMPQTLQCYQAFYLALL